MRVHRLTIVAGLLVVTLLPASSAEPHSNSAMSKSSLQHALHAALAGTAATSIVLDAASGNVLAVEPAANATQHHSAPGSILKPFFLAAALKAGAIQPQTTVLCHRDLRILGHNLACSHPQTDIAFNAEEALAYSCNTYFADLGGRLSPSQAVSILREYGLAQASSATPAPRVPVTREDTQLLVLGVAGIQVSPAETAAAYRKLALRMTNPALHATLSPVQQGMLDSVHYGAAHNAEVPGLRIAGKTGTASDPGQAWTHGWFAGIAGEDSSRIVVVVYVPHGNGADAATFARRFFLELKAGQTR